MHNLLQSLFLRTRSERNRAGAHMTFGQTSLGRTMSRTALLFKKQLWIWPIVAIVLLAIVGYAVSSSIHQTMENTLRSQLQTLLTVERSMLEKWLKVQESSALTLANSRPIRDTIGRILAAGEEAGRDSGEKSTSERASAMADLQMQLAKELGPGM